MDISAGGDSNINFVDRQSMIEEQELDASQGRLPLEVYSELLALYILHDDLNNSKFLWKRIPAQCKSESAELKALWEVSKAFWRRDYPGVYHQCSRHSWSDAIQKVIDEILRKHREKCTRLIAESYSNIGVDSAASLLGCSSQECIALAVEKGWGVSEDQKSILPGRAERDKGQPINNGEHLEKLTQYISFLET